MDSPELSGKTRNVSRIISISVPFERCKYMLHDSREMGVQIDCECGSTIHDTTDRVTEGTLRVQCDVCEGVYAVTITQLRPGK